MPSCWCAIESLFHHFVPLELLIMPADAAGALVLSLDVS
jgi:hypothetical protein